MGLKSQGEPISDSSTKLWFGRQYKGMTIEEMLVEPGGSGFLLWSHANVKDFELDHALLERAENHDKRTRWELETSYYWRNKSEVTD